MRHPIKITFFILSLNTISLVYTNNVIKATKIICIQNSKYFVNHTCRLKPVNRYKSVAFLDGYLRKELRNVSVNIALYARNDVNTYNPFLVNFTQNICWYLGQKQFGTYMKVFMDVLTQYTNVNHSCPYSGLLIARNLYLEGNSISALFPKGTYKGVLIFYEGYPFDHIGTVEYYAELFEARKILKKKKIK
ncbi:uncharacterized protein LOC101890482 [Musca domestica]|uniref:Uncharacterized protein LOC101890482 n=1 Tax=Musca domestica TaxID=7370 RepID=A0A9J7DGD0_MUSDO|nr:uncharacterized protein LOC101890482 [Musca domestica]